METYGNYIYMIGQALNPYVTSAEAATLLGARQVTVSQLCQHGRLPALKIANRWLVPSDVLEEFAKTYVPRRGRPRTKRKYTKRSPKWFE